MNAHKPDYSYQKKIVSWVRSKIFTSGKTIVVAAAPGSGKTDMVIDFLTKEKERKLRTVIIPHNQLVLRNQWAERLKESGIKFIEATGISKVPETIAPGEVLLVLTGSLHSPFLG